MDHNENRRFDSKPSCPEICEDELYSRDALGNIISQLFENKGEFFGVPNTVDPRNFHLLSVFVKEGRKRLVCIGSLCKDGGLLVPDTGSYDLLRTLLPHFHTITKQDVDQHLTCAKRPFTRKIRGFWVKSFEGRPEGKYFSWLEMGCTKVVYIDELKLAAKLDGLRIDPSSKAFLGRKSFYLIHKICHSDRLHYYRSTQYSSNSWLGKDTGAIASQIKEKTKLAQRLGICSNINAARGFCLLKVNFDDEGYLQALDFNVKLVPTCSQEFSSECEQDDFSFPVEVLDHEYLTWLVSMLKRMRTRHIWQPAIKELFTELNDENRKVAIKYLLDTVQRFQTEEEQPVQMVDLSFAIANIPSCLEEHPSILASLLRGVEIVVTQPQDSDDENPEKQIVFQPTSCQPSLKIIEQLLTVLDKGVVTSSQGEAAAQLLPTEVVSLQELFYTQMACVCSPLKSLNPQEEPLRTLWKKLSRTRNYLESVGLYEDVRNRQKVVVCPETLELINILSIFFPDTD